METIAEDTGSGLLLPDDADFHLRDPNFSNHLVKSLQTLRECEHFCDVKLVAGTRSIHAHRAVLAAASPYFRALLGPNMAEGYMQNIEIQDIDPYALAAIVNYIYSSELTVKGCKVEQILKTADFLDLQTLCLACCQFLCKHLNSENCLDMYFIADHYGCDELRDRSLHLLSDCLRSDPNQSLELYDMAYRTGHHELQRKALETVPLLLKSNPDACVPLYKKGPEHPEMMALALEYLPCYLEAHIEDYLELYHGAISQHQDELRDKILEYLPMYLASDPNQCIPLYLEACQDGQSDLQAKTMEFMLTEFWRITQTDSFMLLPPDVFLNILKNEKLSFVPPGVIPTPGNQELGLLKIILDFIHHKPDDCKQYLHQYLKFMKLPTLPKSALCDMMQDPMIPSDCIDILNAAQARKQVMADSTKKRMPKTVQRQSTGLSHSLSLLTLNHLNHGKNTTCTMVAKVIRDLGCVSRCLKYFLETGLLFYVLSSSSSRRSSSYSSSGSNSN